MFYFNNWKSCFVELINLVSVFNLLVNKTQCANSAVKMLHEKICNNSNILISVCDLAMPPSHTSKVHSLSLHSP